MGLLCRELNPVADADGNVGDVWRHHNLRLAYIAQHHMETLGKFFRSTPFQYLQHRYTAPFWKRFCSETCDLF